MKPIIFDLEADGLLYEASRIWCISTYAGEGDTRHFGPDEIEEGLRYLQSASNLIGHNIAGYDIPLIEKLYPWFDFPLERVYDTHVMSRLFDPDKKGHSLDDWARELGGQQKVQHEDWTQYSEEMRVRCDSDVQINKRLWFVLRQELEEWDWFESLNLETSIAYSHAQQVLAGVQIDVDKAYDLAEEICLRIQEIDKYCLENLPLRVINGERVDVISIRGMEFPNITKANKFCEENGVDKKLIECSYSWVAPFKKDGNLKAAVEKYCAST